MKKFMLKILATGFLAVSAQSFGNNGEPLSPCLDLSGYLRAQELIEKSWSASTSLEDKIKLLAYLNSLPQCKTTYTIEGTLEKSGTALNPEGRFTGSLSNGDQTINVNLAFKNVRDLPQQLILLAFPINVGTSEAPSKVDLSKQVEKSSSESSLTTETVEAPEGDINHLAS